MYSQLEFSLKKKLAGKDPYALLKNIWDRLTALESSNTALVGVSGSKTYVPGTIANGATVSTTVTVTGATLGKVATAAFSLDTQGVTLEPRVSAANTVTVVFRNSTGGSVTLASGTLSANVR